VRWLGRRNDLRLDLAGKRNQTCGQLRAVESCLECAGMRWPLVLRSVTPLSQLRDAPRPQPAAMVGVEGRVRELVAFCHGCQRRLRRKRSGRWLMQQGRGSRTRSVSCVERRSRDGSAGVARRRGDGRAMREMERSTAIFRKGIGGGECCSSVSNVANVREMKSDGPAATPLECQALHPKQSGLGASLCPFASIQANSVTSASHAHHPMLHSAHHCIDSVTAPCVLHL
jgi:hypothetical protein